MSRSRRNKRSSSRRKTSKHNSSEDEAGQAIAAGGFGCVFKPAIVCRDSAVNDKMQKTGYEYISKVMIARYAREEMKEVNRVLPIVKNIPNNKRYFLLDGIFECRNFGPLNAEDLKGFTSKCRNLQREGISSNNVNNNLGSLSTIYIPFGGDSVATTVKTLAKQYIANPNSTTVQKKIGLLVWGLSDVLENAVVPMNNLGLVHLDLKGDNMLINQNALEKNKMPYVKIIDWGLAGVVPKSGIAKAAKNRPLQYNTPFSNILFNTTLVGNIILGDCYTNEITAMQITSIATQIVVKNVKDWSGHADYIAQDLQQFLAPYNKATGSISTLNSKADCTTEPLTIIVEYIATILRKYMKKNVNKGLYRCDFDSNAYFEEVYRYNCDVWGLLTAFQNFIEQYSSYSKYRDNKLARAMSNIMFKYCFSPTYAAERIPIKDVVDDMRKIAGICGVRKNPSTENETVKRPSPPKVAPHMIYPAISPAASNPQNKKLVLRQATVDRGDTTSLKGKKRCPKGYSKHPSKPGKCRKTAKKSTKSKRASPKRMSHTPQRITLPLGRKRCPVRYKRVSDDDRTTRIVCARK